MRPWPRPARSADTRFHRQNCAESVRLKSAARNAGSPSPLGQLRRQHAVLGDIAAGQQTLKVSKDGYKSSERTLRSSTGSIKIAAVLEPIAVDAAGTTHIAAEVAATSTKPDPAPPANSSEGMAAEARIGIMVTGNPTARHDGVEISGVQPNGPADRIGIQPGDVILAIDGHYLYTIDELRAELLRHESGARLRIQYRRDRIVSENSLTLGKPE